MYTSCMSLGNYQYHIELENVVHKSELHQCGEEPLQISWNKVSTQATQVNHHYKCALNRIFQMGVCIYPPIIPHGPIMAAAVTKSVLVSYLDRNKVIRIPHGKPSGLDDLVSWVGV